MALVVGFGEKVDIDLIVIGRRLRVAQGGSFKAFLFLFVFSFTFLLVFGQEGWFRILDILIVSFWLWDQEKSLSHQFLVEAITKLVSRYHFY